MTSPSSRSERLICLRRRADRGQHRELAQPLGDDHVERVVDDEAADEQRQDREGLQRLLEAPAERADRLALVLEELVAGLDLEPVRDDRPRPRRPVVRVCRPAQVQASYSSWPEFSQSNASASGIDTVPSVSSASVSPNWVIPTMVAFSLPARVST